MIYKNYEELIKEHPIPIYSDLREFVKLYARFGIECRIKIDNKFFTDYYRQEAIEGTFYKIRLSSDDFYKDGDVTTSEKFTGFDSYHTEIVFDKNGHFINQGFWE